MHPWPGLLTKVRSHQVVVVSQPQNRKKRLRNHSKLVEFGSLDFRGESHYPNRPPDMVSVCLYDFVAEYVKCGEDKDGTTVYWKREKRILPNNKVFDPNKSYHYSILCSFPQRGRPHGGGRKCRGRFQSAHARELLIERALCQTSTNVDGQHKINQARKEQKDSAAESKDDDGPQVGVWCRP